MSTSAKPRGYEPWAEYDRRLSAEAGIDPALAAVEAARDPELMAQWLRANCLDFRDLTDGPDVPLEERRAAADRLRGIAAHFLSFTGGDYASEGEKQ